MTFLYFAFYVYFFSQINFISLRTMHMTKVVISWVPFSICIEAMWVGFLKVLSTTKVQRLTIRNTQNLTVLGKHTCKHFFGMDLRNLLLTCYLKNFFSQYEGKNVHYASGIQVYISIASDLIP